MRMRRRPMRRRRLSARRMSRRRFGRRPMRGVRSRRRSVRPLRIGYRF